MLAGGVVPVVFGADVVGGAVTVLDPLIVVVVLSSVVTVTEFGVVTTVLVSVVATVA